jgi:dsRNA-specific ribonuclease
MSTEQQNPALLEPNDLALVREQAWIGDAVLALYARRWILAKEPKNADRTELFKKMTSNQFLSAFGEPTRVEARIGRIYEADGEQAAFRYIEETILPLYLKHRAGTGRR